MVITLSVANESNRNFTYHGENKYFLSQGKTIESANKNMYKYLRGIYYYFESEVNICNQDLTELLYTQFSPQWCEGECWTDLFPEFTFIRSDRAGIIEISQEMFDKIIEYTSQKANNNRNDQEKEPEQIER